MERVGLRLAIAAAGTFAVAVVACGGGAGQAVTTATDIPQSVGLELVSRLPDGTPSKGSSFASVSGDGRFVAFASGTDGLVSEDANGQMDIFLRDRQKGTTALVSHAADGKSADDSAQETAISADGRFIAYVSWARNAVYPPRADRGTADVYLWDRESGRSKRISAPPAGDSNGSSMGLRMSTNGRYVVFASLATNLTPGDPGAGGFIYSADTGKLQRLSPQLAGAVRTCSPVAVSDDGRRVACRVYAPNGSGSRLILVDPAKGTSADPDICLSIHAGVMTSDGRFFAAESCSAVGAVGVSLMVYDLNSATSKQIAATLEGFDEIAISADGMRLAFKTSGPLVDGDLNGRADVYFTDRSSGFTSRVSVANDGTDCGREATAPSLSVSGHFVAFTCEASEGKSPLGGDFEPDVYVRDAREKVPVGRVIPGATPVHGPARYPTPAPTPTDQPAQPGVVTATDNRFSPSAIVTTSPVEVRFENHGQARHTIHFLDRQGGTTLAKGADGPITNAGEFAIIRFEVTAGTYYYQCDIHPDQMRGVLTVR